MTKEEQQLKRWSWWQTANGKRIFVIVGKYGHTVNESWVWKDVELAEVGVESQIMRPYSEILNLITSKVWIPFNKK